MSDFYKPTVRYDSRYKDYVQALAEGSGLSVNQIMRLALFCAPFCGTFMRKIKAVSERPFEIPVPAWTLKDDVMWLEQKGPEKLSRDDMPPLKAEDLAANRVIIRIGSGVIQL